MQNPLGQLGELKKMRDQAMQIQRQLAAEEVTVEKKGILVVITGDQKLKEIKTNGKSDKDIAEAGNIDILLGFMDNLQRQGPGNMTELIISSDQ